jgi:hypothetical protein
MSGDYSRQRFNPKNDFSGVLQQQGRVQLDADWNELVEILDRRWRAETTDIIGRCIVPKETPEGFKIEAAGGTFTIGRGRIYVDGLLAENHGKQPLKFDRVLAEEQGKLPLPYTEQPYFPNAPSLPVGGPHLVYIDVWQREATYLERPDLIEQAVGVDTTARLQTVWQVKVHPNIGTSITCNSTEKEWEDWLKQNPKTSPSAGRLSTEAVGVPNKQDPCELPPTGGYRGLENQLYRVEIHDSGPVGTATFKWSRENATVATAVTAISGTQLTVDRTGWDAVRRFSPGDWVEITDDWREFIHPPQPGIIRRIQAVDDGTRTITLTAALPAGDFPTTGPDHLTDPIRHTRIRRWDQKGKVEVRDANGNLINTIDLDASNSVGVIPVPADGNSIILEDGVKITFHTDPAGGNYRVGDYWVFYARTATSSYKPFVEELQKAPPRGIHHHYGRLAIVTFPDNETDCRTLWPPEVLAEGCDCTICVTAESHNKGTLTIQWAIDQVKANGGTICLGAGIYNLGDKPVFINGAQSVRLKGQGWKTMLLYGGSGSAIAIEDSIGVTVEELTVFTPPLIQNGNVSLGGGPGVALQNCLGVTIQRCGLAQVVPQESPMAGGPAIALTGVLMGIILRENWLFSGTGIGNLEKDGKLESLYTLGLSVQDNFLRCEKKGISLEGFSLHLGETRLSGNFIGGCSQGGIVVKGFVYSEVFSSGLNIEGNQISVRGNGIVIGTDGTRICNNNLSASGSGKGGHGILLARGHNPSGIDRCQVLSNRITGVAGHGIALHAKVRSAMIKQNVIEAVGNGGIVMEEGSSAEVLNIENNQILNIASKVEHSVVGIRLLKTDQAEVASNTIRGVGRGPTQKSPCWGIQVVASSSVRIAGNEVVDIGPPEFVKESAGIEVLASFDRVDVVDNLIRRSQQPPKEPGTSSWFALRIRESKADFTVVDENIGYVAVETLIFGFFGKYFYVLPRGREVAAVRGNLLETYGNVPGVVITGDGASVFNDNRCLLTSKNSSPVTVISAGAVITNANYLQGPLGTEAMRIMVPPKGPYTVAGNITSGPIMVNGAALGAPWAQINAIAI